MAVLCLSTLFVGCDKACTPHADENADLICDNCSEALKAPACKPHEDADKNYACDNCSAALTVPCETHKDENADKLCDVCGLAIVTITELGPPTAEERVDMVVNPLPENSNPGEFLDKVDTMDVLTSATKLDGNLIDGNGVYNYYTVDETNSFGATYKKHLVINSATGEKIYEISDLYEGNLTEANKYVYIDFSDCYFTVRVTITGYSSDYYEYVSNTPVYLYMSYNGQVLYNLVEALVDLDTWAGPSRESVNNVTYVTFANTVYAFEKNTTNLIATLDKMSLVYRPKFDYVNGNYGYVYLNNKHVGLVYDLTKWVDCVYSYDFPSYYENMEFFFINNGNLLVQACVRLADNAVSYDVLENGAKYDIVYLLINPATKTATEIEFGYYIVSAEASDKNADWNEVVAYPIVNDRVDYNHALELITDKDLKILFNDTYDNATVVADGIILVSEEISNGLYVNKLINTAGDLIAYVPASASIHDNYIVYDGKLYNFSMQMIFDPAKEGYVVNYCLENYLLLSKLVPSVDNPESLVLEYYYYNIATKEANKFNFAHFYLTNVDELYFVVRHDVAVVDNFGETSIKTVYSVFNYNGELIFEDTSFVINSYKIGDGVYDFDMDDGSTYIVK